LGLVLNSLGLAQLTLAQVLQLTSGLDFVTRTLHLLTLALDIFFGLIFFSPTHFFFALRTHVFTLALHLLTQGLDIFPLGHILFGPGQDLCALGHYFATLAPAFHTLTLTFLTQGLNLLTLMTTFVTQALQLLTLAIETHKQLVTNVFKRRVLYSLFQVQTLMMTPNTASS
jgi:hypothetical protein